MAFTEKQSKLFGHAMYEYCWQNKRGSKGTVHKVDPESGLPACGRVRDLSSLEYTDDNQGAPYCKLCFKTRETT